MTERTIPLDELRAMLGASRETYESFPHFRQFVLNIAQRQLKIETDLAFALETFRKGRKVSSASTGKNRLKKGAGTKARKKS